MNRSSWIWINNNVTNEKMMVWFRRTIEIEDDVYSCPIEICADSRYLLLVNGERVMTGPARSFRRVWLKDTVDLAPFLRHGHNEILVKVIAYPDNEERNISYFGGPASVCTTGKGGLWIQELKTDLGISTTRLYECCRDKGYFFLDKNNHGYIGEFEEIDARLSPVVDEPIEGDANGNQNWWRVCEITTPITNGIGSVDSKWHMHKRPIPKPFENRKKFSHLYKMTGIDGEVTIRKGNSGMNNASVSYKGTELDFAGLRVHKGETAVLEIGLDAMTNGYPIISLEGKAGTKLIVRYAECYGKQSNMLDIVIKGIRDAQEGQELIGFEDYYTTRGGQEVYMPFYYRTFRMLKITIEATDDTEIKDIYYVETGYPLEVTGNFESEQEQMNEIWNISKRTLSLCMYETYMDCPYFEQMAYAMDTFLEIRYTLAISGDARLVRKTIEDFAMSQLSSGFMPCFAPAKFDQLIAGFPLYWVQMLETYVMYVGDKAFVKRQLGTLDRLISFYEDKIGRSGLVESVNAWHFMDWARGWKHGCPAADDEIDILLNMLFVYSLRSGAKIQKYCGRNDTAAEYERTADAVSKAIVEQAFDAEMGLFANAPGKKATSRHAQIFAVVANIIPQEDQKGIMERMIKNMDSLAETSYAFSYFLCRALEQTGLYNEVNDTFKLWDKFKDLISMHVTTWPEDFLTMRSDCHGWSAVALYEFATCYLGVKPAEPGFKSVRINPLPSPMKHIKGTVPAGHKGIAHIEITTNADGSRDVCKYFSN